MAVANPNSLQWESRRGTGMIEEFLIISPRGDTLLTKNYAGVAVGRARAAM